mmetsp:Transcript_1761/g.2831  ORF Transcript_1761/g.2831 Transcript_1761/m.2831 type:complete len:242 (+) Transcript_1761:113-838(+)
MGPTPNKTTKGVAKAATKSSIMDHFLKKCKNGTLSPAKSPPSAGRDAVIIRAVKDGDEVVGVTVEGGYPAREYLGTHSTASTLNRLAPDADPALENLPFQGVYYDMKAANDKFAKAQTLLSAAVHAPYILSQHTRIKGGGKVLFFSIAHLYAAGHDEDDTAMTMEDHVLVRLRRFFTESKKPPQPDAGMNWYHKRHAVDTSLWHNWTIVEEEYKLANEDEIHAFQLLSEDHALEGVALPMA